MTEPAPLPPPQPDACWLVYIDGSTLPNPGAMRIGGIAYAPDGSTHQFSQALGRSGCNNEAEALAAIYALQWLQSLGAQQVLLHTDNSILAEQLSQAAPKPIARLAPVYAQARSAMGLLPQAKICWIPRHKNAEADRLARGDLWTTPSNLCTMPADRPLGPAMPSGDGVTTS